MSFNANIKPGLSQNWPWAHLTDEHYTLAVLWELICTNHSHLSICRPSYFSHLYSEKKWNPQSKPGLEKKGNKAAGRIALLHMEITTAHNFPSDRSSSSKLFPPEAIPCFFKGRQNKNIEVFTAFCSTLPALTSPYHNKETKLRTWRCFPCLFCHVSKCT